MSAVYPSGMSFPPGAGLGVSLPATAAATSKAAASWSAGFVTPGSNGALPQGLRAGRGPGLVIVILVHALIAWALASGLARNLVEIVKRPIEMIIVPEVVPEQPPPPPPPPKIEKLKDTPKPKLSPPPAYVPPPDVAPIVEAPAPVIEAIKPVPPPEPVAIEPPPPPPPPAPVARLEPPKQEIGLACPGYQAVIAEAMESAFERVGIPGTVKTLLKVRGSQVIDVIPQSGPKQYYKYLQTAIKRMRCATVGDVDVHVTLDVVFQP